MDMENLLANIKTDAESEEELTEGALLEDSFKDFALPSSSLFETETPVIEAGDPLQVQSDAVKKRDFHWQYNEEDFLNDNIVASALIDKKPSRGKRAKLETDLKGCDGTLWYTEQQAIALTNDLKALPVCPKGKGPARELSNPLEAWHLLIDDPILVEIVKYTNDVIRKHRGRGKNASKAAYHRPTDVVELRAWLGLNYLCGLFRNAVHNGPLEELWTLELGNSIFRATMSVKRYELLAECIRFSDVSTQNKKPLEPVRQIWEKFIVNCRSYYAPGEHCSIDEHILSTADADCPFRFSLPHQPAVDGLRLVTLCDAKTLYMCNAFLATDNMPTERDILHLVSDIKGTNRTLALSERYTTLQLASKMQKAQLCMVGALSTSAQEIPPELLSNYLPRELYTETATLTYTPNTVENATELLLSTGISPKIHADKLYASTFHCCERFQQLSAIYNTEFATPATKTRWALKFFHVMLNFAAFNAWVLLRLSENGNAAMSQRDFLRQLGLYLTQQQLKRRLNRPEKLTVTQKLQICEILGEPTDKVVDVVTTHVTSSSTIATMSQQKAHLPVGINLMSKTMDKRARCRMCSGKNSPKTRIRCQQCLRALCHRHLILRCTDCTGTENVLDKNGEDDKSI